MQPEVHTGGWGRGDWMLRWINQGGSTKQHCKLCLLIGQLCSQKCTLVDGEGVTGCLGGSTKQHCKLCLLIGQLCSQKCTLVDGKTKQHKFVFTILH